MERRNTAAAKAAGIPLKLLIDRRTKTVVLGEAGKELVDFLFSLLSLPLATIVGLLGTHSVPGSLGKLFDSIEKLDNTFILTKSSTPEQVKEELLNPTLPSNIHKVGPMTLPWNCPLPARGVMLYACDDCWYDSLSSDDGTTPYVSTTSGERCPSCGSRLMTALHLVGKVAADRPIHGSSCSYYKCADCCHPQVASVSGTRCPSCAGKMCCKLQFLKSSNKLQFLKSSNKLQFLKSSNKRKFLKSSNKRKFLKSSNSSRRSASTSSGPQRDVEGFVQGVVTYTITDDLTIAPLSTISTISFFQKLAPLRVQDLSTLEERIVTVGRHEGLQILKASLHSKKVLTEVFLSKQEKVKFVRVEPVDTSSSTGV